MLGVLTAQSADEPAPLAPSDPHRIHGATSCRPRELAPEELPTLPIRAASSVPSFAQLACPAPKLLEPVAVVRDELQELDLEGVLHGAGDRREVTVLDEDLELASPGHGDLHRAGTIDTGLAQEAPHGVGTARQSSVRPVPLEPLLFLGRQSNAEESARAGFSRSGHFV